MTNEKVSRKTYARKSTHIESIVEGQACAAALREGIKPPGDISPLNLRQAELHWSQYTIIINACK